LFAALQKSRVVPIFNRMRLPQSFDRRWKRAEAAFTALWDRGQRRGAVAAARRAAPLPEAARPSAPAIEPVPAKTAAVGLALQGGGAHGAFTWGVLDRLLEADILRVGAISGASAGALNAAVAADGLLAGGPDGARAALEGFWRTVSAHGAFTPYNALDKMINGWNQDGAGRQLSLDIASRLVSPYQFNPLGHNPLRDILTTHVDFDRLSRNRRVKLFIAATDVRTGRAKIFRTSQLTVEVLLASAALPSLNHAVEIDGVPYWDGGFSANPPLIPLVEKAGCEDILLIQVEPPHDDDLPVTASAIRSRLSRLTFMAPLNRELDALRWIGKVSSSENGPATPAVRMHRIDSGDELNALGQFSKLNPEWGMLQHVRDIGRKQADAWLARKAQHVGDRATFRL
jgi:NTE family protein